VVYLLGQPRFLPVIRSFLAFNGSVVKYLCCWSKTKRYEVDRCKETKKPAISEWQLAWCFRKRRGVSVQTARLKATLLNLAFSAVLASKHRVWTPYCASGFCRPTRPDWKPGGGGWILDRIWGHKASNISPALINVHRSQCLLLNLKCFNRDIHCRNFLEAFWLIVD